MSPRKSVSTGSPDPLAANLSVSEDEIIILPSKSTPRKRPIVELDESPSSTKKRRITPSVSASATKTKSSSSRTPLGKAPPGTNSRNTPTPASTRKKANGDIITPAASRGSTSKPRDSLSRNVVTSTSKKVTPMKGLKAATLGSSTAQPLPTPTRAKAVTSKTPTSRTTEKGKGKEKEKESPMRNFDEAFDEPSSSIKAGKPSNQISRDEFLANEALRRQREARNFVYKGDVDAPKLTRSGRVVGRQKVDEEDMVDEYGAPLVDDMEGDGDDIFVVEEPEQGAHLNLEIDISEGGHQADDDLEITASLPSLPGPTTNHVSAKNTSSRTFSNRYNPLPEYAKPHILRILQTLTGQGISTNPPAFIDEETNESLQTLVNLLKGTVERGEGNSALLVGPRGSGKTRTMSRALNLLPSGPKTSPIIVRLSGLAQTNDRLAIREMGRQIAEAEGRNAVDEEEDPVAGEDEEYAPTTLPSHLLALLTAPSPRAIVIVMEEFDMFTEHARQALLYCLLDVVQSIKTGPVETTGRGVAVIGLTTRTDTLLLLEKRVKSRFSHRILRVVSPLSPDNLGWEKLLRNVLIPWTKRPSSGKSISWDDKPEWIWKGDWEFAVDTMLSDERCRRYLERLCGLTTDVRNLYRPFIEPISNILQSEAVFIGAETLTSSVTAQIEGAGWGLQNIKLKGLPQPAQGIIIVAKHLHYAGREEFNFAQVEEEYLRFSRTKLVGSGKTRWPIGVLRSAFDHLLRIGLLASTSSATVKPQFSKVRCTLSPHDIVAWFKGEGANGLGPEMGNWGRVMGGHA